MADGKPQLPGDVLPRDTSFTLPNGEKKVYKAGTPMELIRSDHSIAARRPHLDTGARFNQNAVRPPDISGPEAVRSVGSGALDIGMILSSLYPGTEIPAILARIAMAGGLGAAKGALNGNTVEEGGKQAGYTAAGEAAGAALPYGGYAGGLALKGLRGDLPDYRRALGAFTRQYRRTRPGRLGISVDSQSRTLKAADKAGERIGGLVDNSPATAPGSELMGAGDELIKKKTGASRHPLSMDEAIDNEEEKFIYETLGKKNNVSLRQVQHLTPEQATAQFQSTPFTMRELQDYAVAQGREGNTVINSRIKGNPLSAEQELTQGNVPAAASKLAKAAQEKRVPGLKDARTELSDLKTMQKANVSGRNPSISNWAIRGATGASVGSSANYLLSDDPTDPAIPYSLASILGILGLHPRLFSGGMNALGTASRQASNAARAVDAVKEEENVRTRVRRRTPGGK